MYLLVLLPVLPGYCLKKSTGFDDYVAKGHCKGEDLGGMCSLMYKAQGCRQLFRTGGRANKVKTKELQFGSRRRVREGDMPPPAQSAEAKIFFKIQEVQESKLE